MYTADLVVSTSYYVTYVTLNAAHHDKPRVLITFVL